MVHYMFLISLWLFSTTIYSLNTTGTVTLSRSHTPNISDVRETPSTSLLTPPISTNQSSSSGIPSSVVSKTQISIEEKVDTSSVPVDSPVPPSSSVSKPGTTSNPVTTNKPSSGKTFCKGSTDSYCGSQGVCTNKTNGVGVDCLCKGNYYGDRCQYKGDFLYKQLTYAFGGTTGFLLLVICCLLCCRKSSKQKSSEALEYSQELDEFTIANKRASTAANITPANRNGFNM